MFMIIGQMTMAKEAMGSYAEDVQSLIDEVVQEDGCQYYSLAVQDEKAGLISVTEIWSDENALNVHLKQPWVQAFNKKYMSHLKSHTLKIYDGDYVRDF